MKSLPRGRHGLSRDFVAKNQRERLLSSIAEALHEHGYERTTVSLVTNRARVSKSDFYRHFSSKDACFLVAYDNAVERLREQVLEACSAHADWADGVCAALSAALVFLAREPAQADMLLVEGLRAGPGICDRFQAAVRSFVPYLRDRAPHAAIGGRSPEGIDDAVVGGIASLLSRRVLAGEAEDLERFFPDVAEFTLTPYLGSAEARRILSAR
jgi:AcrR family transcriptional regulator